MLFNDEDFKDVVKAIIRKKWNPPNYDDAVKHAKEMAVHVYGEHPTEILERTRPRETDDIKKYRMESYEPITMSACGKAFSIVNKIFNPTLQSIVEKDDDRSKEFGEYMFQRYPGYKSVLSYLREVVNKKMMADANGLLVVVPERTDVPQSARLKPICKIFGAAAVVNYDWEHFLVLTARYDKEVHFEYFDDRQWVHFVAKIKTDRARKDNLIIDIKRQYDHEFGEIPAWRLRGVSEAKDNGEIIFKSFFQAALPFWNLAITHESDVFGAYIQHMHPMRWEAGETCDYISHDQQKCKGGSVHHTDGAIEVCPRCNGTGAKPMNSPFGVLRVPSAKLAGNASYVPAEYITVPVEPTLALEARADKMLSKGLWAMNMHVADQVGENQSGDAKEQDREELNAFLSAVSETLYDTHLYNICRYSAMYMFDIELNAKGEGVEDVIPTINKPTHFNVTSVVGMTENFKIAKDSGLDRTYLLFKQKDIANKDFGANPEQKALLNTILDIDPLPGYTPADISALRNDLAPLDIIVHNYLKQFVERAWQENEGKLITMEQSKIMELMYQYAKEKKKEIDVHLDEEVERNIPPKDKA